jgi:DNA-binding CsgD family transcriptional regulator
VLEQFGFTRTEERLYVALVETPELTAADLARLVGTGEEAVPGLLDRLRTTGLVRQLPGQPGRYCAIEPDQAFAPLIAARTQRLEHVRTMARHLGERFRAARPGRHLLDLVEPVVGAQAQSAWLNHLWHLARDQIRGIEKLPWLSRRDAGLTPASVGVRVRNIYDRGALEAPVALDQILSGRTVRDEQVRIIDGAPFDVRLADDRLAMILLHGDRTALETALLVHPSALLDGISSLFEMLWRYAVPLQSDPAQEPWPDPDGPSPEEAKLLRLIAAGMTDEAAARHLGLSLRTVQRQVRAMMNRLGAETRFQAGLQAYSRGWL